MKLIKDKMPYKIVADENKKINRVIVDSDKLELVNQLYDFAKEIIEKKEK